MTSYTDPLDRREPGRQLFSSLQSSNHGTESPQMDQEPLRIWA